MCRLIFFMLLIGQFQCIAQAKMDSVEIHSEYIVNQTVYKKGIYKTFEDFKYNRPSITDNYSFERKNLWVTDEETGRLKKIKRGQVWGFTDGTRIYVSWRKYDELLEIGRYCYFREKGTRVVFGFSMFPPMILPIPVPYKDELIINFNTGKPYLLSKKLLKRILATDDKELLNEFMKQNQKGRKLFEYIKRYNDRNASKIK